MSVGLFIALVGLLLVVEAAWSHRLQARAVAAAHTPRHRPLPHYPSVTVVRPVRGRDVGADLNFAAALGGDYPGEVETIFIFDEESDPALPLARAVVAAFVPEQPGHSARVIVAGPPPKGRTGKLNAMLLGARVARGELLAFGDSDTRPDREVLRVLVETLYSNPRAGCAFAPVVVGGPARTLGDVGYALLINGLYGPAAAVATDEDGSLPFIMGQLMLFRPEALASVGGVACAEGHLVDDMRIGACLHEAGWKNVVAAHPLHIATGGMTLSQFVGLFRRWLLFSRNGLPLSFTWPMWLRGIEFWVVFLAGFLALASGHPLAAMFPALAMLVLVQSLITLQRSFGGAPIAYRYRLLPALLFFCTPMLFLVTRMFAQEVNWRGRAYELDRAARLSETVRAPV